MNKRKILIPLDDSDISRKVLPYVCDFFSADHYEILLLRAEGVPKSHLDIGNIASRPMIMSGDFVPYGAVHTRVKEPGPHAILQDEQWTRFADQLKDELQSDMSDLESKGYNVSIAVHFGKPADEIVGLVEHQNVALVAMASHGRTGVSRLLQGSVTEDVLRHLPVPLMVINVAEA